MRIAACTTFYPGAWDIYARMMVETFVRRWNIPLYAFFEGAKPPDFDHERLHWKSLECDSDRTLFMSQFKDESLHNYRRKVVTYSHKVWTMTNPRLRKDLDCLIWLDADVETFRPVGEPELEQILPREGEVASYLGRQRLRLHTETGFLAFNLNHAGGDFLDALRAMYTGWEIVQQREQHDCQAFDMTRERFRDKGFAFRNLSGDSTMSGVFRTSAFKNFCRHHKGDRKFALDAPLSATR